MKTTALFLTALITALTLSAHTYVYDVGPFDRISQLGNINIVYSSNPDSIGLAFFQADTNLTEYIEVSNNKGKLSVTERKGHELDSLPTLHVYSDYISQIKTEGDATVTADLTALTPTLSLNLVGNGRIVCTGINSTDVNATIATGNGSIVMRGLCTNASYRLTGAGTIQADGLISQFVKCTTVGTGTIGCNAVQNLEVRAIGTTKIYYLGSPVIKKTGGGTLIRLDRTPESDSETDSDTDSDTD